MAAKQPENWKWKDLPLNTKDRCLLCLNKVRSEEEDGQGVLSPPSSYSLRFLLHYLKVDLRKVIAGKKIKSVNSSHRFTDDERCHLEVELCEWCSTLHEEFLEMYQRLQEIELGMTNCLQRIQGRLTTAPDAKRDDSEMLVAVRKEVVQKCSSKVIDVLANAQGIIAEAMNAEKRRINSSPRIAIQKIKVSGIELCSERLDDRKSMDSSDTLIKSEPLDEDESGSVSGKEGEGDDDAIMSDSELGMPTVKSNDNPAEKDKTEMEHTNRGKVPPKTPSRFNPATGKHKCNFCWRQFPTKRKFTVHFNSTHRITRYDCDQCPMKFALKCSLKRHKEGTHMGIRFTCQDCKRVFVQYSSLRLHQRKTGCDPGPTTKSQEGPPWICRQCGKEFKDKYAMNFHVSTVHSETEHLCDICGTNYKHKRSLLKHRRKFHSDILGTGCGLAASLKTGN